MQVTSMGCIELHLEIHGGFQCSQASLFLQAGLLLTALYIEVLFNPQKEHAPQATSCVCLLQKVSFLPCRWYQGQFGTRGWLEAAQFPLHLVTRPQHF